MILLLELSSLEAKSSGLDGQYIKTKYNKNGRYKVDPNEGNHLNRKMRFIMKTKFITLSVFILLLIGSFIVFCIITVISQ